MIVVTNAIALVQRHLGEKTFVRPDEAMIMNSTLRTRLADIRTPAVHNLPAEREKEHRRGAWDDVRELNSSFLHITRSNVVRRSSGVS
jgi:hypothetical protein